MKLAQQLFAPDTGHATHWFGIRFDAAAHMLICHVFRAGDDKPMCYFGALDVTQSYLAVTTPDWLKESSLMIYMRDMISDASVYSLWFSRLDEPDDMSAFVTLMYDHKPVAMATLLDDQVAMIEWIIRAAHGEVAA